MIFTQGDAPTNPVIKLTLLILVSALILGFAYTYAQDNKGKKVTFIIITINVIFLPWAMLLLTLVMAGPEAAMHQATGIFAAHLYDFLTRIYPAFGGGRDWIQTPYIVKKAFGAYNTGVQQRAYGSAIRTRAQPPRTSGASTGISSIWGSRGAGRRLGGD